MGSFEALPRGRRSVAMMPAANITRQHINSPPSQKQHHFCTKCDCASLDHAFGLSSSTCGRCAHGVFQHYSWFNRHVANPIRNHGYQGRGRAAMMVRMVAAAAAAAACGEGQEGGSAAPGKREVAGHFCPPNSPHPRTKHSPPNNTTPQPPHHIHSPPSHHRYHHSPSLNPPPSQNQILKREILPRVLLRRTKVQCADDLALPPRTLVLRRERFDEREADFYEV